MEFTVVKIMDGVLLTDTSVLQDHEFVCNNKVSHMIGWLQPNCNLSPSWIGNTSIESIVLLREQINMPNLQSIQSCISAIERSREQCLCCMIYSERIQYCFGLLIPYLVCRFGWAVDTAVGFIEKKIEMFKNIHILEYLQALVQNMTTFIDKIAANNSNKLKTIIWSTPFLNSFTTDDLEEQLIVNTVKNMISSRSNHNQSSKKKKKKRIQWFDQVSKSFLSPAQRLFVNSRITSSLKNSSCFKNAKKTSNLIKVNKSQELKIRKEKGSNHKQEKENNLLDQDYLSLRDLSRTHFDSMKYRSCRFNKRRSIKIGKSPMKTFQSNPNSSTNILKSTEFAIIAKNTL